MPDQSQVPDYEAEATLRLEQPEQLRALFDDTRHLIVALLSDKAATVSQLADVLGRPKGTIGYHMKVLEDAGLVRVIRTEKVRAIEAKYYGRTARIFDLAGVAKDMTVVGLAFTRALEEMSSHELEGEHPGMSTVRYARIPKDRAQEWQDRLVDLVEEFIAEPREGDIVYGLMLALFPTKRPYL
jgi:DNA-binding transcriptional ArsR family regulator